MKKTILSLLALLSLSACQATHLIYVHDLNVGIDVSASTETSVKVAFGYDRRNFVIVPKKGDKGDAMSLVGTSCISSLGLNRLDFNHFIATGKTADNMAILISSDPSQLNEMRKLVKGDGECAK